MTSFLDLQTRTLRRLIDAPPSVVAEVPLMINDVYAEIQSDHKFWEAQRTYEVSTTEGSHILGTLPTDWAGFRGSTGWYRTDLGDSRRIVLSKSWQEISIRWNANVDIGEPRMVVWGEPSGLDAASGLWVWPLPDGNSDYSDGEYRVKVPYWSKLPTLVADADTTWLTNLAATYLIAETVRRGFMLDWDEDRAKFWSNEAAVQKRLLLLDDKMKWLEGAEPMVPYPDVFQPKIPE